MPDGALPAVLPASARDSLAQAVEAMASGAIVGLPTETVYGVGVVPRPETLRALIKAKGRAADKGIAVLIDDLDQVDGLVRVGPVARRLGERFWPGPLTLVLPLQRPELVPEALTGGRHTLALRLPDHPVPRALARELGPIAVTSANRSGDPEAHTAGELVASLGASVAMVLDDGPVRGGIPSSVVAVDAEDHVILLREGAIAGAEIWSLLDEA